MGALHPRRRSVLDTSVVRRFGNPAEAEIAVRVPRWLRTHGFSIHLGDPTIVEVVNQLCQLRFRWQEWQRAKAILVTLLDPDEPILTGGIRLLSLEGLLADPDPRYLSPSANELREEQRAAWLRLLTAGSPTELSDLYPAAIGGRTVLAGTAVAAADPILAGHRDLFASHIVEAQHQAETSDREGILKDLASARRGIIAQLDADGRGAPPLSKRLDARIRFDLRKYELALTPRTPYNPTSRKNRNDAIDAGLLDYLALPAVVCTADGNLIDDVRLSGSPQVRWMLNVDCPNDVISDWPPDMGWDEM